ncbi:MAG: hypothetical protein KDD47_20045, partial [Acidobacteria bacterium]|nr:hypothetical protein [Acidobacteriota bacterium]
HPLDGMPRDVAGAYARTLAVAATQAENSAKLRELLEKSVRELPGSRELWVALAKRREQAGETKAALEAYTRAMAVDPSDDVLGAKSVRLAWELAAQAGDDDARLGAYRRAAALAAATAGETPSTSQRLTAGEAFLLARDPATARRWLTPATEGEGSAQAHYFLARCALQEEDSEAALRYLERATSAKPQAELLEQILQAKGEAFHRAGQFDLAAEAYRQAGRSDKAEEMKHFGEIAAANAEIDRKREACLKEQAKLERLRKENQNLMGSEDWQSIERLFSAKMAECRPYLES